MPGPSTFACAYDQGERGSAHLRPIGGNLFTSEDGDYALARYAPPAEGQPATLWVTTHSGIRALAFSHRATD